MFPELNRWSILFPELNRWSQDDDENLARNVAMRTRTLLEVFGAKEGDFSWLFSFGHDFPRLVPLGGRESVAYCPQCEAPEPGEV